MRVTNWVLDPSKYLSKAQACKLLATARDEIELATGKRKVVAVRDYFIIHLGLATGLRVMEMAALNCDDVFLGNFISSLQVRRGKGGKGRTVYFNNKFKQHCKEYLLWKQRIGESVGTDDPLLLSSTTGKHMTTRAMQKAFKRCARDANLPSSFSIHCLRHTYACFLLKASDWNLRLVQKQLGHSRITTTQIYLDVMMPDIKKALDRLYL